MTLPPRVVAPSSVLLVLLLAFAAAPCGAAKPPARRTQCWHGGFKTISQLNGSIDMLIREFLANGDLAEAERSLHELASKPYHHEFVRRCFDAAFERPERRDAVARLLQHMCTSGATSRVHCACSVRLCERGQLTCTALCFLKCECDE